MHLSMFRSWIRIELVWKTLMRRMTFAVETAVVVLVRYERVHVTVRTRNRLAAFPLTGPPQIRKICAVFSFLSLFVSHTPLLLVISCSAVHGLSWQTSRRDLRKITCRSIRKKNNNNTRKKMPAFFVR